MTAVQQVEVIACDVQVRVQGRIEYDVVTTKVADGMFTTTVYASGAYKHAVARSTTNENDARRAHLEVSVDTRHGLFPGIVWVDNPDD